MSLAAFSISFACFSFSLCLLWPSSAIASSISNIWMNPLLRLSNSIVQVFQVLSPNIFARSERAFSSTNISAAFSFAWRTVSASV